MLTTVASRPERGCQGQVLSTRWGWPGPEPATHGAGHPGFTVRPRGGGSIDNLRGSSRWVRSRQTTVCWGLGQQAGEASAF